MATVTKEGGSVKLVNEMFDDCIGRAACSVFAIFSGLERPKCDSIVRFLLPEARFSPKV